MNQELTVLKTNHLWIFFVISLMSEIFNHSERREGSLEIWGKNNFLNEKKIDSESNLKLECKLVWNNIMMEA